MNFILTSREHFLFHLQIFCSLGTFFCSLAQFLFHLKHFCFHHARQQQHLASTETTTKIFRTFERCARSKIGIIKYGCFLSWIETLNWSVSFRLFGKTLPGVWNGRKCRKGNREFRKCLRKFVVEMLTFSQHADWRSCHRNIVHSSTKDDIQRSGQVDEKELSIISFLLYDLCLFSLKVAWFWIYCCAENKIFRTQYRWVPLSAAKPVKLILLLSFHCQYKLVVGKR